MIKVYKEQKCLPVGVLEEIPKFSQNQSGRARAGVLFLQSCSLQIAYKKPKKRLVGQLYQIKDAYTETLTQLLSVNFEV